MKITIVTIGSRGDIQPFLALGVSLNQAGHQVKLATHDTFASWIKSYGLDLAKLEGNPQEWLKSNLDIPPHPIWEYPTKERPKTVRSTVCC